MTALGWHRSTAVEAVAVPAYRGPAVPAPAGVARLRLALRNEPAERARLLACFGASWVLGLSATLLPAATALPALAGSVLVALAAGFDRRRRVVVSADGLEVAGWMRHRTVAWSEVVAVRPSCPLRGPVVTLADGRRVRLAALRGCMLAGRRRARVLTAEVERWHRGCRPLPPAHVRVRPLPAAASRHPAGSALTPMH